MQEPRAVFDEVRQQLFPRWDRGRRWALQFDAALVCQGCCRRDERVLRLRPMPGGDGLRLLIVHEICHCIAGCSHGRAWQQRMEKAAVRAAALGQGDLSRLIADEAAASGGRCIRPGAVYAALGSCAAEFPASGFDETRNRVCRRLGLCMEDFGQAYPRARQVFESVRRADSK